MTKFVNTLLQYKFTLFIGIVVLFLSLMSSAKVPSHNLWNFTGIDKVVHFAMYFALSFIFFYEKYKNSETINKWLSSKENLIPAVILIIFSGIIELIQPVLANRSCELFDFVANTIGVIAGFWFYKIIRSIIINRKNA